MSRWSIPSVVRSGYGVRVAGHVFISYHHASDSAYVEQLATFLTGHGVAVWFDREIVTGDRWHKVIEERIDTCAVLIVVMSPGADGSPWVNREITRAEKVGKLILPMLLAGEEFFRLGDVQFEDVRGGRMPSADFLRRLTSNTIAQPLQATALPVADGPVAHLHAAAGDEVSSPATIGLDASAAGPESAATLLRALADQPDPKIAAFASELLGSIAGTIESPANSHLKPEKLRPDDRLIDSTVETTSVDRTEAAQAIVTQALAPKPPAVSRNIDDHIRGSVIYYGGDTGIGMISGSDSRFYLFRADIRDSNVSTHFWQKPDVLFVPPRNMDNDSQVVLTLPIEGVTVCVTFNRTESSSHGWASTSTI